MYCTWIVILLHIVFPLRVKTVVVVLSIAAKSRSTVSDIRQGGSEVDPHLTPDITGSIVGRCTNAIVPGYRGAKGSEF